MQQECHQRPLIGLVPLDGKGTPIAELEAECLADLLRVAEYHLTILAGSGSPWVDALDEIRRQACDSLGLPSSRHLALA
jgi:hypothetical protein